MKIANIFLARDGDFTNSNDRNFDTFLSEFSKVILSKNENDGVFDFSNVTDLRLVVPNLSNKNLIELADANSEASYTKILDAQLLNLSGNADGSISVPPGNSDLLVAIENGDYVEGDTYARFC